MGGETPDADGPGDGPGLAAVGGFRLQGFAIIGRVVVTDVGEEAAVGGFDGVPFVVVLGVVAGAGGEGDAVGGGLPAGQAGGVPVFFVSASARSGS
jgi:hypothetical protein